VTGSPTIPAEHSESFHEDKTYDDNGRLITTTGVGADGKVLYTHDSKGFHAPTADGEITQADNGAVTFKGKRSATVSAALPDIALSCNDPLISAQLRPLIPGPVWVICSREIDVVSRCCNT